MYNCCPQSFSNLFHTDTNRNHSTNLKNSNEIEVLYLITGKNFPNFSHSIAPSSMEQSKHWSQGPIQQNPLNQLPPLNNLSHLLCSSLFAVLACVLTPLPCYPSAWTIHPPTNRPRDISTQTKRPPNEPSAVKIYYCDIPSQDGQIVCPPQNVTF